MSHFHKYPSREGFERLAPTISPEMSQPPNNPNDVTIDIPLTNVPSSQSKGARKQATQTSFSQELSNEKETALESKHTHFSRGAGRRRKYEQQGLENTKPRDGTLTTMGRIYDRIYHTSVLTRYLLYIVPVATLIAVPIVLGATVFPDARVGGTRMTYFCVWLEVFWCSIWISKLVARFLPHLFQFLIGVVSSGTRKYAMILAALELPLSLVGWFVADVASFRPLMTTTPGREAKGPTYWITIAERILFACLFSAVILLVEKLLIQLISISYHRKQFDDKIKDSKHNVALICELFDASRAIFPMYGPEFAEEDYVIADILGLDGLALKSRNGKRSGVLTPGKIIQNMQRVGDGITSAFGNMASEITGKRILNPTATHSLVVQALEKRKSSEALARRLWLSFVLEGKDELHLDDLLEVFGPEKQEEADEIFSKLDIDGNGDVSLDEMVLRISEIGRERAALANSMRDVDQAIQVLDNLLMAIVFVAAIFIFVAWLNQNFVTTLATAGTALLSLSFVFAATAQELLGSCIFLFVKHPYDVGDRVDISGESLIVERISLLYTMFRKVKDHKRSQAPNIVLNSLWIDNISRSKAMREAITINCSFDTSFEDIELLRKEMQAFVLAKENARDFQPEVEIECVDMESLGKLQLKIECRHKSNWSNESVRAARRSKFMCALVLALKKIPIYPPGGGGPPAGDKANPNYAVTISHEDAVNNKSQFDKDKNAKRLIPVVDESAASSTVGKSSAVEFFDNGADPDAREQAQIQGLNHRSVAVDASRTGDEYNPNLEQQKSHDLEEVKNILRKQSTRGRRKPSVRVSSRIPEDPREMSFDMTRSAVPRTGSVIAPTHSTISEKSYNLRPSQEYQVSQSQHQQSTMSPPAQMDYPAPAQNLSSRMGSSGAALPPSSQLPYVSPLGQPGLGNGTKATQPQR